MKALPTLFNILKEHGLNEKEIDELLAKFLEEEAADYLEFCKSFEKKKSFKKKTDKKKNILKKSSKKKVNKSSKKK